MNLTTSIGKNCRSILREHYCQSRTSNQMNEFNPILKQGYSSTPCNPILTNPIHSFYGVDHLRVPLVRCEEPNYCNTLLGLSLKNLWNNGIRRVNCIDRNLSPIQSSRNRQSNCAEYLSKSSDNSIQMITNCIIHKIRSRIPPDEMSLLCCCLPSLIRQMMCNSPWLTPNDIVQWLSTDILKESMNCFDQVDSNFQEDFNKTNQNDPSARRLTPQQDDNNIDENHSIREDDDDHHHANVSLHPSKRSTNVPDSQHTSKSNLDVPGSKTKQKRSKTNQSRTPSTRSFTSQRSKNLGSDSHHSDMSPSWDADDDGQSQRSDRNTPFRSNEDARSTISFEQDRHLPMDSTDHFDRKSTNITPKTDSIQPSSRTHIEYPGKKDSNAIRDVEKCLAFYQQIREHFDDEVAAMLLKCCLCYGDCSGKK